MKRRSSARRGSTLIEFALVTFLLMTVIFAGIEFDRMVLVYTSLGNAARAGVRYAIVHGSKRTGAGSSDPASGPGADSAVIAKVRQYAGASLLNSNNVNVTVEYLAGNNNPGSAVKVSLTYRYDAFTALPFWGVLDFKSSTQGIIVF